MKSHVRSSSLLDYPREDHELEKHPDPDLLDESSSSTPLKGYVSPSSVMSDVVSLSSSAPSPRMLSEKRWNRHRSNLEHSSSNSNPNSNWSQGDNGRLRRSSSFGRRHRPPLVHRSSSNSNLSPSFIPPVSPLRSRSATSPSVVSPRPPPSPPLQGRRKSVTAKSSLEPGFSSDDDASSTATDERRKKYAAARRRRTILTRQKSLPDGNSQNGDGDGFFQGSEKKAPLQRSSSSLNLKELSQSDHRAGAIDAIKSLNEMATSKYRSGDHSVAIKLYEESCTIARKEVEQADLLRNKNCDRCDEVIIIHVLLVETLNSMATIFWKVFRTINKSISVLEEALHVIKCCRSVDTCSREISMSISMCSTSVHANFGAIYFLQKDFDLALQYMDAGLNSSISIYGIDHPTTVSFVSMIGSILEDKGEIEKAIELHESALSIQQKSSIHKKREVVKSLLNLSNVLVKKGKLDDAKTRYNEALLLQKQYLGPNCIGKNVVINLHEIIRNSLSQCVSNFLQTLL